MKHATLTIGALALGCAATFGQTPAGASRGPAFEVATVKPGVLPQANGRGGVTFMGKSGGPGTTDPGQITWPLVTLKTLLTTAYDVKPYQVTGPAWLDTERYAIVAKVAPGATAEQVNLMWQNLLADRFGVVLHHESKEFQVQELVVAKSGSKLKETDLPPDTPIAPPSGPPKFDKSGVPQLEGPGMMTMMQSGPNGITAHLAGRAQTLAQLATTLGGQLNHPVLDKTGLTGKYDFVIEFTPDSSAIIINRDGAGRGDSSAGDSASTPGSTLTSAVLEQLGLRLVSSKAMLDVLVIDKANKEATEN